MPPQVQKATWGAIQKNHKNWIFKVFNIFLKYYILSTSEALIHSIWTSDEKVMDNLLFQTI